MILYIKQAGSEILHKGKVFRTPIKLKIQEKDLPKYLRMMKSKSIHAYEIVENSAAQSIRNIKANVIANNDDIVQSERQRNVPRKQSTIRGVDRIILSKDQKKNSSYHDSIESEVDLNISLDINSDDILQELLSTI